MFYQFPTITHLSDVLPHVEGRDDFVVAVKDGYTVINYILQTSDTFRPDLTDRGNLIRRECRGLIFDNETGVLIRRPFHKFFNVGEREETLTLDLTQPHQILVKLDGSMIAPFKTSDGRLRWGTKMVAESFETAVSNFVERSNIDYEGFARDVISSGCTPIFEWMSRDNRIVIDYGAEPKLTLLAIRNMITGVYQSLEH